MTKEVEDIIKNKAYIELTDNERERVGELAQNEEEYNNMKWFLTGAAGAFSSGKIQASPGLKKGVMQHLTESKKKKGFWLNSVGVFMLPEGKKFYQKPAFQLGIAAVAVVGCLFFFNNNLDDSLAVNEQPVNTNTVVERDLDADETVEQQLPAQDLANEDALNKERKDDPEFEISTNANNGQRSLDENANRPEVEMDKFFEVPAEELEEGVYIDYAPPVIVEKAEDLVEEVDDIEEDVAFSADEVSVADDEDYRELNEVMLRGNESELKDAEGTTNLGQTVTTESDDRLLFKRDNIKNKSERADVERKKRTFNKFSDSSEVLTDMDEEVSEEEPGAIVGGAAEASSGEWIVPKSMHINKTKELNQLFHIEK